jgi:isopenicillin N synthase-like dioxygenase
MKQFFGQSLDEKRKIAMTNCPEGHRGYFGLLEENTDVKNSGDVKEGVDFGHDFDHDPSKPIEPLRGINQWPDDSKLPGWRETVKKYFDAVNALGKDLLRGLALDLGLDELYFHHMVLY